MLVQLPPLHLSNSDVMTTIISGSMHDAWDDRCPPLQFINSDVMTTLPFMDIGAITTLAFQQF
jgi:hypothetical protein